MKGRILLVDDEEIVLRSCQRILRRVYEIDIARDGLEALGKVNQNPYDVLILDIKMPKMDGIEVLRRVKEARPDIDVIMVTGLHEIGTAVKAMKLGALEFLEDNDSGALADYIPELAKADPSWFGMSLCTIDGHVYDCGDSGQEFTIQSVSKPFVYALALADNGPTEMLERVGVEPSGRSTMSPAGVKT